MKGILFNKWLAGIRKTVCEQQSKSCVGSIFGGIQQGFGVFFTIEGPISNILLVAFFLGLSAKFLAKKCFA